MDSKSVTLNFDTSTPHPQESTPIQGTNGVLLDSRGIVGLKIYLDSISPESHRWEDAAPYMKEYRHGCLRATTRRTSRRCAGRAVVP